MSNYGSISLRQILERARNRSNKNGEFNVAQTGYKEYNAHILLRFRRNGTVVFAYSPWSMALSHVHDCGGNIPIEILDTAHDINSDPTDPSAQYLAMVERWPGKLNVRLVNGLMELWSSWVLAALDFNELIKIEVRPSVPVRYIYPKFIISNTQSPEYEEETE